MYGLMNRIGVAFLVLLLSLVQGCAKRDAPGVKTQPFCDGAWLEVVNANAVPVVFSVQYERFEKDDIPRTRTTVVGGQTYLVTDRDGKHLEDAKLEGTVKPGGISATYLPDKGTFVMTFWTPEGESLGRKIFDIGNYSCNVRITCPSYGKPHDGATFKAEESRTDTLGAGDRPVAKPDSVSSIGITK